MHLARRALLGGALVALGTAAPVACVDLFHSTSFENACDLDAAACGPSAEASALAFPADFCAWPAATALANASRACAWLGACGSPIGDNAFGACVVRARLAYDCALNPDRRLLPGAAHDFWDALWRAQSCTDVLAAVLPPHTVANCAPSSSSYAGCPLPDGSALLACDVDDAGSEPGLESCAAFGQTCATVNGVAGCAGSSFACAEDAGTSCVSATQLEDCDPSVSPLDQGVDCASVGAGSCVAGSPAACAATGDAGCAQSAVVTCSGGVASGCPSGFSEQVDCNALLGSPSCDPSAVGRAWDVSRACSAGASCPSDSCGPSPSSLLNSCARGAAFSVDCASVGLSACRIDPVTQRAACVPAGAGAGGD